MNAAPVQHWLSEVCPVNDTRFSFAIRRILHEEQTPFQHLLIADSKGFGHVMMLDGCVMLTTRDEFIYHEMMTLPALCCHTDPARVAIIGGGDCGSLHQVLTDARVKHITQVEIDRRVTDMARRYFPQLCAHNDDPRARLLFEDGVAWMKQQAAGQLNVIMVDSTDPVGPAEGLFNQDFYRDCRHALDPQGILVQQSESPIYYPDRIKPMRRAMRDAGFDRMITLNFHQPCYPSGWWSVTLARSDGRNFSLDADYMRSFNRRYISPELFVAAQVMPECVQQLID